MRIMKVLMISSDRNILVPESAVHRRMAEYGELVDELHIVVLSPAGLEPRVQISSNVWAYPTNSKFKFSRPFDALTVGEKIDADLITTQDPFECGWVGVILSRAKRVPIEVQLHTNPFSKNFGGALNLVRKFMMGRNFKEASGVRVVLKSVGDEVRRRFGVTNVYTLPIYVDRDRVSGEAKFDLHEKYGFKQVLLMVSRLTEEKNIGLALDAFKTLRKEFPDACLVIVGSGPEKFDDQEGVVFVGWQEDLVSYYKTADVFVQTSKFEGYGLSLVEAGLCGLPVVTTKVGLAEELKDGEEVLIFEPNEASLAKVLSKLISDQSLRRGLVLGLKKALEARLLDKEAYKAQMLNNWQNLVGNTQR